MISELGQPGCVSCGRQRLVQSTAAGSLSTVGRWRPFLTFQHVTWPEKRDVKLLCFLSTLLAQCYNTVQTPLFVLYCLDLHCGNVMQCIYSKTVVKYKFEVLVFYLKIFILCKFILLLHYFSEANIARFNSLHLSDSFSH